MLTRKDTQRDPARFETNADAKKLLGERLDPIGLPSSQSDWLDTFLDEDRRGRPWLYAAG
jgi:hypothetical protein